MDLPAYQLRSWVRRRSSQSYCILVSDQKNNARLKAMKETTDDFKIAEADLQERETDTDWRRTVWSK